MKKLFGLILIGLSLTSAYAGGYRVGLQGQKALAMGHAGVAVVNSSELAFYNPSGIVWLENKLNISAGVTPVISNTRYQNLDTRESFETEDNIGTPFYLYATYQINDWLAAGLAVNTPYGSAVEWPTDWAGSHLVNNIELAAIFVNPTISVKLTPEFSIGGGPIFVTGGVNFNRNYDLTTSTVDGRANITIDAQGVTNWGFNASAMFKPSEDLTIGATYRSKIDLSVEEGDVEFDNLSFLENTTFDASLPLPAELGVGVSYKFCEKWLVTGEFTRSYWGVYESLDINFHNGLPSSINPRNYSNTTTWRVGGQYDHNDKFTFRAGYYFDESPVASGYFSPETPRNDSHGFTTGLTYRISDKFEVDASFLYLHFDEITESYDASATDDIPAFEGTYVTNVFTPGIGVTYKL